MALKQITNAGSAPDGSRYVTLTDGAGNLGTTTAAGGQIVTLASAAGTNSTITANSDGLSTQNALIVANQGSVYNGTTYDRARSVQGSASTGLGVTAVGTIPTANINSGVPSTATTVAAGSLVLKAAAGNVYSVNCTSGGSAGYLMLFNATSAPADGAVTPAFVAVVAANSTYSTDFEYPIYCGTGATLVFSTTGPFTKTISATAFLAGQVL